MSLIDDYLNYVTETEAPEVFHRWSIVSTIGAMLGKNFYFEHGFLKINPNLYVMLMGSPGVRKSSAIKGVRKLAQAAGYEHVAHDRTSKEKFLADLAGLADDAFLEGAKDKVVDLNVMDAIFGDEELTDVSRECYITADEFNNFLGAGNLEFASILGDLWDFEGVYTSRTKNSKSLEIHNPIVSILGGNTPTGFATAFPPEVIGQGFLSRLILVHGEPTGKKIAFPEAPNEAEFMMLAQSLQRMRDTVIGVATFQPEVKALLTRIYETWPHMEDTRFIHYYQRRFNQLIKLTLIMAAANFRTELLVEDVLEANTLLAITERDMPKALGHFGAAKNAAAVNKIMEVLEHNIQEKALGMNLAQIYKQTMTEVGSFKDLQAIVQNLITAKKIELSAAMKGYVPIKHVTLEYDPTLVNIEMFGDSIL